MSKINIVLIGEGSLTLACAEVILENKTLQLIAVVSQYNPMLVWCEQKHIYYIDSRQAYLEIFRQLNFDYLICAINENKLSDEVIQQAKICSINYHDSLLPQYPGSHATSWALVNGELQHGVTWHKMSDQIDQGDVILQKRISITVDETSFSLNLKCFDLAIKSLSELIQKMVERSICFTPQTIKSKKLYYKATKPSQNGIITASLPLDIIQQWLQAAEFGYVDNDFFTVKIKLNAHYYSILKASCQFVDHDKLPGTIHQLNSDSLVIAYRYGYLVIHKLANRMGVIQNMIEEFANKTTVDEPFDTLIEYQKLAERSHAFEKQLVAHFRQFSFEEMPILNNAIVMQKYYCIPVAIDEIEFLQKCGQLATLWQMDHNGYLAIETEALSQKILDQSLFLPHSFIALQDAVSISQQLQQLLPIQSDILSRYRMNHWIVRPAIIVSLKEIPTTQADVVFNLFHNKVNILVNVNCQIPKKLLDAIETLIVDLQRHC